MAQRVVVTLSDDIDGGEAAETVTFGLDGRSYEIDLTTDNAKSLRTELAPFVEAGRKRAKSGKTYHRTSVAPDPRAVRAWARVQRLRGAGQGPHPQEDLRSVQRRAADALRTPAPSGRDPHLPTCHAPRVIG